MQRLAVAMAAVMIVATGAALAQAPRVLEGRAYVTDGDTLEINNVSIRLDGFDTPERGHRCAGDINPWRVAKDELDDFIANRTVRCDIVGRDDRNNRAVGRCSVGGVELGAYMVAGGWARDWPQYSCGRYASIEAPARSAQRGFWGMSCPDLWGNRDYTRSCAS